MVKFVFHSLTLLISLSSVLLAGCQSLKIQFFPQQHVPFICRYSEQIPTIPPGKKAVLVGGVFDVIHYGHLCFLKAAKSHGDYLIIAIEPDAFVEEHKHRVPVHTQEKRAEILSHIDIVDAVIMLPTMEGYKDYLGFVEKVRPSVIAITEGDPYRIEKEKQATMVGAKVIAVVNRRSEFSTSEILKHMCR